MVEMVKEAKSVRDAMEIRKEAFSNLKNGRYDDVLNVIPEWREAVNKAESSKYIQKCLRAEMLICEKAAKEAMEKNLTPEQADVLRERLWTEYMLPSWLVDGVTDSRMEKITEIIRSIEDDIIKEPFMKQQLGEKVPELISFLKTMMTNCEEMEKLVREKASQLAREFANKLGVPPEMIYEGGVLTPSL